MAVRRNKAPKPSAEPAPVQRMISTSASSKPLYAALGLPESASSEEIRAAFLNISMAHHPDATGGTESEIFLQAKLAYETLFDPAKRKLYDECGIDSDTTKLRKIARDAIRKTALRVIEGEVGISASMPDGSIDIPGKIRESLQRDIKAMKAQIGQLNRAIEKAERQVVSIERRWKGAEAARAILIVALNEQIAERRQGILPLTIDMEAATIAVSMLDGAEWQAPEMPDHGSLAVNLNADWGGNFADILRRELPNRFGGAGR